VGSSKGGANAGSADVGEDGEGAWPAGVGANGGQRCPMVDGPAQVEVSVVDALPCTDDIRVSKEEPRLVDAFGGDASAPGPIGPWLLPTWMT
jgi:hypothetical protein